MTFPNSKHLSKMSLVELDQEIDLRMSEGLWGVSGIAVRLRIDAVYREMNRQEYLSHQR
jgi:hypothetical protein